MDFLTSILNNLEEGLIIINPGGIVLLYNDFAFRLSKSLLLKQLSDGCNLFEIVGAELNLVVEDLYLKVMRTKSQERSFAECTTETDSTFYLDLSFVPIVRDGNVTHILVFVYDITQQKLFEKRLVTQVKNTSNLIEKANAVIIGVDTRGYITDWNNYTELLTGYSRDEALAQLFAPLLLMNEGELQFGRIMHAGLRGEFIPVFEMQIRTKGKKIITLLLSATSKSTSSERISGLVFVGQDVTEISNYRNFLEAEVKARTHDLQQALSKEKEVVELKSRFVSIASHEFRTPLSSILAAVNLIRENSKKVVVLKKLENIEKQATQMVYFLDDVLTYGKNESNQIKVSRLAIGVTEFVYQLVDEVGHSTKHTHRIELNMNCACDQFYSDEKLLRNILINLLTNAIKFSPDKNSVYLHVNGDSHQISFKVCDNGIGISNDEIDHIFEPFVRSKAVELIPGTGLGLSIAKKAVELLSGKITISSALGRGTEVTVLIPVL